ncbi:MAG TPA: Gfo/Idh/MocA family oxidoreductase [Streptosporangiaceae bacterium]|nr:Gfo/Idh/MocA family oxidoreductase [Streptosporangiaceae bacterium]
MKQGAGEIRWGILGTANIARAQFLPGLREAGRGRAAAVAGREAERARAFASDYGVDHGVAGYARVVESAEIDAVYVALPNSLHSEWTIRALQAGKAVLCEKPLSVSVSQTAALLEAASAVPSSLLWEAFVFPFQAQCRRLVEVLSDGAIGEPAEIVSAFHFQVSRPADIRLSAALGGGSIADVGCYPVRLAHELFGPVEPGVTADAEVTAGSAVVDGQVEVEAAGLASWGARRLLLTCGFRRAYDTFTRILGDRGQVHLTNPYHPGPSDTLVLHWPRAESVVEHPTTDAHSFTAALRHIHAVLLGEEAPQHTAAQSALATARTVEALQSACGLR